MSMSRVVAGNEASIDDLNQIIDLLQGTSGFTEAFLLRCAASSDFKVRLSDAAGARRFEIQDSAGNAVAYVDSDGNLTAAGLSLSGALVLPTAASPSQTTEGSAVWDTDDDHLTVGTGSGTKILGLVRGAGASATALQEFVYDTAAAQLNVWDGSSSVPAISASITSLSGLTQNYKSAATGAQTISASTSFADIVGSVASTFSFTPEANGVYLVEALLNMTFTGTGGFKLQFTGPASPTRVDINAMIPVVGKEAGANAVLLPNAISSTEASLGTAFSTTFGAHNAAANTYNSYNTASATNGSASYPLTIAAVIANGSTSSAVTLQAAQNSANGTSVIGIGSWFRATRIA